MSDHAKALAVIGVTLLDQAHQLREQDARMTELANRVAGLEALARWQTERAAAIDVQRTAGVKIVGGGT